MLDILGSLSNEDGDGNENGKKAIGLISKTTTLHLDQAFFTVKPGQAFPSLTN